MPVKVIHTDSAPAAIGPYSQAVQAGDTVYMSGQIPMDPATGELVTGGFSDQAHRAFTNLQAVAAAAGGDLNNVVKLNIYLTDLDNFAAVNEVMQQFFNPPFPARAAIGVASLPKGAQVEVDAVLVL
ncbi:MAG: RidA family protein [Pseudomonadota bacterium]